MKEWFTSNDGLVGFLGSELRQFAVSQADGVDFNSIPSGRSVGWSLLALLNGRAAKLPVA